jgi:inorganic pyrophosphatase
MGSSRDSQLEQLFSVLFQAHPWHGVRPDTEVPGTFNAYVEIVALDTVKYELDKPSGLLRVDRPQRFSSLCPTLYGFIPQTYCGARVAERCQVVTGQPAAGDKDPLDICILSERPFAHGNFLLRARPIGGLLMVDAGEADDKIVAVLEGDVTYGGLQELNDAPSGILQRLRHYFLSYKQPPGAPGKVAIAEVYAREVALEVIRRSREDYEQAFGAPQTRYPRLADLLQQTTS